MAYSSRIRTECMGGCATLKHVLAFPLACKEWHLRALCLRALRWCRCATTTICSPWHGYVTARHSACLCVHASVCVVLFVRTRACSHAPLTANGADQSSRRPEACEMVSARQRRLCVVHWGLGIWGTRSCDIDLDIHCYGRITCVPRCTRGGRRSE